MKSQATFRLVTGVVAALCIMATQVELSAFRQEPATGRESAPVKVSVKMPVTFTRPVAKPAIRWSDQSNGTTASQEKSGSKKKWIWIAAAAGGGAAAFFLLKKDPVPVITVGPPTVGPLQIGVR